VKNDSATGLDDCSASVASPQSINGIVWCLFCQSPHSFACIDDFFDIIFFESGFFDNLPVNAQPVSAYI
jgi:hypothetical protein